MKIEELVVGDRVLIQSDYATKEVAQVKAFDGKIVIVKNSFGDLIDIEPQYIIKSFGRL